MPLEPIDNPRKVGGLEPLEEIQNDAGYGQSKLVPLEINTQPTQQPFQAIEPMQGLQPIEIDRSAAVALGADLDSVPGEDSFKLPTWANISTAVFRPVYNLREGVYSMFGSLPHTAITTMVESGIIEEGTAREWRTWVDKSVDFLSKGPEGNLLEAAIQNVEGAPDELELQAVLDSGNTWLNSTLPQGLGSLVGFALVSRFGGRGLTGLGMPKKVAEMVAPGFLGMTVNSNELYHDAVAHGADKGQRLTAWGMGLATGWLEAVPVAGMLGRMDKTTAGAFRKLLKVKGMAPWRAYTASQMGVNGIKGLFEEAIQEGGQQFLANLTARSIAGYDPDRGYFDNLFAAAGTGGTVGFIGAAFMTALGIKSARIKMLRSTEWTKDANGRAVPPEGSEWTLEEDGRYTRGDIEVRPIVDEKGHTRWELTAPGWSKDFQDWFANSQVVDDDGNPLQVYVNDESGDLTFASNDPQLLLAHTEIADFKRILQEQENFLWNSFGKTSEEVQKLYDLGRYDNHSQKMQILAALEDIEIAKEKIAEQRDPATRTEVPAIGEEGKAVYVNLRNPMIHEGFLGEVDIETLNDEQIGEVLMEASWAPRDARDLELSLEDPTKVVFKFHEMDETAPVIVKSPQELQGTPIDFFAIVSKSAFTTPGTTGQAMDFLVEKAKNLGHDGIIFQRGVDRQYVVFARENVRDTKDKKNYTDSINSRRNLGSYIRPETATNLGDRWATRGHLGLDLKRDDFFGEFNPITEVMLELQEKRRDILAELADLERKFNENAAYVHQLGVIAGRQARIDQGLQVPISFGRLGDAAAQHGRDQASQYGVFSTEQRAILERQGQDILGVAKDLASMIWYFDHLTGPAGNKKATHVELSKDPGSWNKGKKNAAIFDEGLKATENAKGPSVFFSVAFEGVVDDATIDSFFTSESYNVVKGFANSVISPMVKEWAKKAGLFYNKQVGVDANGDPIYEKRPPTFFIQFDVNKTSNQAGFILEHLGPDAGRAVIINLSMGKALNQIELLNAFLKQVDENVKAKTVTKEEGARIKQREIEAAEARKRVALADIYYTIAHEVGHSLSLKPMRDLLIKYSTGQATEEEIRTLKAIYYSYFEFLGQNKNYKDIRDLAIGGLPVRMIGPSIPPNFGKDSDDLINAIKAVRPTIRAGVLGSTTTLGPDIKWNNYFLSLDEFMANQFARYYANREMTIKEKSARKIISQAAQDAKDMAKAINDIARASFKGNILGSQPLEGFRSVFDLIDIEQRIKEVGSRLPKATIQDVIAKKIPGMETETVASLGESADSFSKAHDIFLNLVQIAQLNPHVEPLQIYMQHVKDWAASTGQVIAKAEGTLNAWRAIGKEKSAKIGKVLFAEAEAGEYLSLEDKKKEAGEWTSDMDLVYNDIIANFRNILDRMHQVTLEDAEQNFGKSPDVLQKEIAKINKEFEKMAKKPYFPYMRFGKWSVTIKSNRDFVDRDGRSYKPGQIISFETFESRRERDQAYEAAKRRYPQDSTGKGLLSDVQKSMQGMPVSFLRAVRRRLQSRLPADTLKELDEMIQEYSPGESFRQKHFRKRKGTHGYSLDAQRSFAAYMRQAAGHIARMEYQPKMTEALAAMNEDVKVLNQTGNGDKRSMMAMWMDQHMSYTLNPSVEWAGLRGFMFQWFLGFNMKSAVVNLTQLPLVSYPYLGARFGDAQAVRALVHALADVRKYYIRPDRVTQRASAKQMNEALMIEELMDRQILEQSLATELALAASSNHLERYVTAPGVKRLWYKGLEWGSYPFHMAEKINRFATALAAYRLHVADGMTHQDAVDAAHDAVLKTQYDYSKWNRSKFMRGRWGVVFLFMNYLQNTLFFGLGGDAGAMRHQLMMFMLAGWMGLPFMEDLFTVIERFATMFKEKLGMKDPKVDLRNDAREFLRELDVNPDLFLHGLGADSMGLATVGRMLGVGEYVPHFDISASLSMGRIIPGVDILREYGENFESGLVRGIERSGGAATSMVIQTMRAFHSNDPNLWKRYEKALPAALRNASKAIRLGTTGAEQTRSGEIIAEYDPNNPRDFAELIFQGLGFQSRRTSVGWQEYIHRKESVRYYQGRKRGILRNYVYAFVNNDREGKADMEKEIRRYNKMVPFPEMAITGQDRSTAIKNYMTSRKKAEIGMAEPQDYLRLEERAREQYRGR